MIVVRYFGGTLLGTGGLIHAYRSAAHDALQNAGIITKIITDSFRLKFTYKEMNEVMQLIKQENLEVTGTHFDLECRLDFEVRRSEASRIKNLFNQMEGVEIKIINR